MQVKILGSAAGGGFPQWNCACHCCSGVRSGRIRAKPRTQTQLAIEIDAKFFLLDASPDLRCQLEFREMQPRVGDDARNTPISAVFLTCAELDRSLGLLLLREFQPLTIYSTASVRRILRETNSMFHVLEREANQATWRDVAPQTVSSIPEPFPRLRVTALPLAASYPTYVNGLGSELAPDEALLALVIEDIVSKKRLFYAPSLPSTNAELKAIIQDCDLVLLDGTFWSNDELPRIRRAGLTARAMGHVPISGANGTLTWLGDVTRPKKVYVHINNTNPVLDEESREWASIDDAGWVLAEDGMEFAL